ncbi:MAG: GNAT family N-acetyltransferase [Acidobacteria bacterium]|nr:MAG: GNAT family N-acetyltransferase [Acidobacteriota bacterium]PYY18556.1 MAG: GNAT family N-acetyltransferase [Acidobacteriota bacterium]
MLRLYRMNVSFRFGRLSDIDGLLPLMRDFYSFERLPYDETRLKSLLTELIEDKNLGRLILFEHCQQLAGYMVLGFGFSLEFHGRDCFIDEFYVKPERRAQGIGRVAVDFAIKTCRELGIEAVHLEADHFNTRGHEFYKRLGFRDHDRHLMTRWL